MDIRARRSWMYNRLLPKRKDYTREFIVGVKEFIEFASTRPQFFEDKGIRCPCSKDKNRKFMDPGEVHVHLLKYGFQRNYWYWTSHGESEPRGFNMHEGAKSSAQFSSDVERKMSKNMVHGATGPSLRCAPDRDEPPNMEGSAQNFGERNEGSQQPTPSQLQVVTEAVSKSKKIRVHSRGGEASPFAVGPSLSAKSCAPSAIEIEQLRELKTQVEDQRKDIDDLRAENRKLHEKIQDLTLQFQSIQQQFRHMSSAGPYLQGPLPWPYPSVPHLWPYQLVPHHSLYRPPLNYPVVPSSSGPSNQEEQERKVDAKKEDV